MYNNAPGMYFNNPVNQYGMYNSSAALQYNNPTNQAGMYNGAGANYYNNPANQSRMTSGSSGTNYFSGSLGAAAGAVGSSPVSGSLGASASVVGSNSATTLNAVTPRATSTNRIRSKSSGSSANSGQGTQPGLSNNALDDQIAGAKSAYSAAGSRQQPHRKTSNSRYNRGTTRDESWRRMHGGRSSQKTRTSTRFTARRAAARTEIAREPPFPPPPILSISDCRTMGVHHGLMAFPVLGGEAKA